jgi:hypothetical protein
LFHAPAAICASGPGTDMPIRLTWEAMTDGAAISTSRATTCPFATRPRARPMAICRVKSWAKSSSRE